MKKQSWTNRKIKFDNYFSISKVFQDSWKIWSNLNVFLSRNSKTVCNIDDTAQKMKFSIKDFFSKCDQIRISLRIWSHLLKKFSVKIFIFCAVCMYIHTYTHVMFCFHSLLSNYNLKITEVTVIHIFLCKIS